MARNIAHTRISLNQNPSLSLRLYASGVTRCYIVNFRHARFRYMEMQMRAVNLYNKYTRVCLTPQPPRSVPSNFSRAITSTPYVRHLYFRPREWFAYRGVPVYDIPIPHNGISRCWLKDRRLKSLYSRVRRFRNRYFFLVCARRYFIDIVIWIINYSFVTQLSIKKNIYIYTYIYI